MNHKEENKNYESSIRLHKVSATETISFWTYNSVLGRFISVWGVKETNFTYSYGIYLLLKMQSHTKLKEKNTIEIVKRCTEKQSQKSLQWFRTEIITLVVRQV